MKIINKRILVFLLVCLMLLTVSSVLGVTTSHKEITNDLILLLEKNPEINDMLNESIMEAKKINPNKLTNPVQSIEEYYNFIDEFSQLIPQQIIENPKNLVFDQILQSLCYFYFLVDQPIKQLDSKNLFKNNLQYYPPFSDWLRKFANTWGDFLDTPESWNEKAYNGFYSDPNFGLQKGWYESPDNWKTFNEFFSRYLKSPDQRPIAFPENDSVVVSPADSVPQGVWRIDNESNIEVNEGLNIKNSIFFNVNELLSADSEYKNAFANGVLTHTFLNVFDYHRYHFAVGGLIKEVKIIQENVALEASWDPDKKIYIPIDSTGWQFTQTRGYVVMETKDYGLVVLMPMGMAQVSSVNFEEDVKVGSVHKKGDMLGTFLFGGSDFIMLFQDKAGFEITAPIELKIHKNPQSDHGEIVTYFNHLLMGQEYGIMRGEK